MIPHSRPTLGAEEKKACLKVLDSLQIAQGLKVAEFEKDFCRLVKRRYAVAVSSGTSALILSLLALEISRNDEVIIPSFNCVALLHALDAVGAKPVLVDIDLDDFNISAAEVKKSINRKTKAILVPHLFGRAARMNELLKFGIPVIEDGTQALGGSVNGKLVGSFGEISVFSFYATKMITTGEGGMVLTDSRRLAEKVFDLRDYDKKENYCFRTNSKMTDLQAAIGIEQLKKLSFFIQRRREIGSYYEKAFQKSDVILPFGDSARDHVYYRYVVRFSKRNNSWVKALQSQGIDIKKPIFKPLHLYLNLSNNTFPATAQAMKQAYSLPIYPSMSEEQCSQVCRAIQEQVYTLQKKNLVGV